MAEYLLTGRKPGGGEVTERIEAGTAQAAMYAMELRGYTDVVLHTDDVAALHTRQSEVAEHITPREYLAFRERGGYLNGVIFCVRKVYQGTWKFYGAVLALLICRSATWYSRSLTWLRESWPSSKATRRSPGCGWNAPWLERTGSEPTQ
jgi:hypothetical protein